jgi:hypothetical protein
MSFNLAFGSAPRLFKDPFRDLQIKVHVRRQGKDMWTYVGRCSATQEILGQSSRIGAQLYEPHPGLVNDAV